MREQKGITLVALVVTIVVLLILAAVSINLVLGENGLIKNAREAKNKTEEAQTNEVGQIDSISSEIDKYLTVVDAFKQGKLVAGDYVNYKKPTKVEATGEGFSETGYVSKAERTGMTIENKKSANSDQTFTLSNAGTQVNWRVLGLSADGNHLLLISGNPLKRETLNSLDDTADVKNAYFMFGAEGYTNIETELNNICSIYKNDLAESVKSLDIEEINRLCKVTVDVPGKQVLNSDDENIDDLKNIGETKTYTNHYASIADFMAGKRSTFTHTSNSFMYAGSRANKNAPALQELIFENTGTRFYWLPSKGVRINDTNCDYSVGNVSYGYVCLFNFSMMYSDSTENGWRAYVRPVVTLKSNVTLSDIQKINTPTTGETDW